MQITIDTGSASVAELTALIALCASLGGRLPGYVDATPEILAALEATGRLPVNSSVNTNVSVLTEGFDAPPAPTASDALIAQEAARVAVDPSAEPAKLDADGIPWDERIHSGTPTLTADGRWRKKRGVNEAEYGRVHAELVETHGPNVGTGISANPTSSSIAETPAAPPPPVSPAPTASDEPNVPNAPATPTVAPPAPTAAAPEAPTPVANAPVVGDRWPAYSDFVQAVSAIRSPTISYQELNEIAQALGLAKFIDLRERSDLWAQFYGMAGGQ